ncbi:hypothetical protein R6242_16210 [Iodobacter sp. CM08]|uniref:hypothetical protein n=1 Tax=Iodobacter sp. CM08 TaxID=3085902 RepID=UPI0029826FA0|nr:hypothetical protein [Iodobacter sp. CM08]MDW5418111.1 hypothetical protein [Iodobacter sp. CM08]
MGKPVSTEKIPTINLVGVNTMGNILKMAIKRAEELGRDHGQTGKLADCRSLPSLKLQFAYMEGHNSVLKVKIKLLVCL